MAQFSFIPSAEVSDLAEDIREIFEELASTLTGDQRAYSGECHPPLDVVETDDASGLARRIAPIRLGGCLAPHWPAEFATPA